MASGIKHKMLAKISFFFYAYTIPHLIRPLLWSFKNHINKFLLYQLNDNIVAPEKQSYQCKKSNITEKSIEKF